MGEEFFAIIDTQNPEERFCFASPNDNKKTMAIYDKLPKIPKKWQHCKKIVKVKVIVQNQ